MHPNQLRVCSIWSRHLFAIRTASWQRVLLAPQKPNSPLTILKKGFHVLRTLNTHAWFQLTQELYPEMRKALPSSTRSGTYLLESPPNLLASALQKSSGFKSSFSNQKRLQSFVSFAAWRSSKMLGTHPIAHTCTFGCSCLNSLTSSSHVLSSPEPRSLSDSFL